MTAQTVAYLYTALAALPFIMHLLLAAGAPLGRFTVGGKFPAKLPSTWRYIALVQAALLALMALVMLERAGAIETIFPQWFFWPAVALTVTTCVANMATPSKPERMLWAPITFAMAICAITLSLKT